VGQCDQNLGHSAIHQKLPHPFVGEGRGRKLIMSNQDIRWQQRYSQFKKAYAQLDSAMRLMAERELTALEKQGVIQAFEYTYELAWNSLKDYLLWQGVADIVGSRDTIRESFSSGLVEDGEGWMEMLIDRNRTSHTYNEETAESILSNIRNRYHQLFKELDEKLRQLTKKTI